MVEKKSLTADSCMMSRTWPSAPAGSSAKARSTLASLLDATMTEAPSAEAALAVANPNPEVPPIMTIRCPSRLRLSGKRSEVFECCMIINAAWVSTFRISIFDLVTPFCYHQFDAPPVYDKVAPHEARRVSLHHCFRSEPLNNSNIKARSHETFLLSSFRPATV